MQPHPHSDTHQPDRPMREAKPAGRRHAAAFLALALGSLSLACGAATEPTPGPCHGNHKARHAPSDAPERPHGPRELTQALGLNADQSRKVDAVMLAAHERHRQIQQQADEQLKGLLTPTQWQRWQELRPRGPHDRPEAPPPAVNPTRPRTPSQSTPNDSH